MFASFIKTDRSDFGSLVLRLAVGGVMLPHGLQKAFGLFGGSGFDGTIGFLQGNIGVPYVVAVLVILGESLGAFSLITGFLTRFCALSIAAIMAGAIFFVHFKNGFFVSNSGYEYTLLIFGSSLALALNGGGAWSVDAVLMRKK